MDFISAQTTVKSLGKNISLVTFGITELKLECRSELGTMWNRIVKKISKHLTFHLPRNGQSKEIIAH